MTDVRFKGAVVLPFLALKEVFMRKYLATLLVICIFIVNTGLGFAAAATVPVSALDKITAVEMELYGMEQTGSMIERVSRIEFDMYGEAHAQPILERVDSLYKEVEGLQGGDTLTFVMRLNAVEMVFMKGVADKPAKVRLEDVERAVTGEVVTGGMVARLNNLMSMSFPDGQAKMELVTLPKNMLVKISIQKALESKETKAGEEVPFKAEENIYVGDKLVIAKGSSGKAVVKKVVRSSGFGRDARIDLDFKYLLAVDGTHVKIGLGELAQQATKEQLGAGAAGMAGLLLFGPLGAIGAIFVHGKELSIPVGATLYTQVLEDTEIRALVLPQ